MMPALMLPALPFTILMPALSLLLVFRTNLCQGWLALRLGRVRVLLVCRTYIWLSWWPARADRMVDWPRSSEQPEAGSGEPAVAKVCATLLSTHIGTNTGYARWNEARTLWGLCSTLSLTPNLLYPNPKLGAHAVGRAHQQLPQRCAPEQHQSDTFLPCLTQTLTPSPNPSPSPNPDPNPDP